MKHFFISLLALACSLTMAAELNLPVKTVNGVDYYYYETGNKESIYGLMHKLGLSRAEILRCNPSVIDGIRPHQVLLFPVSEFGAASISTAEAVATVEEAEAVATVEEAEAVATVEETAPVVPVVTPAEPEPQPVAVQEEAVVAEVDDSGVNIAVLLPLMLDSERPTRAAENFTDFYRGLLLAVDTVSTRSDIQVSLVAFDTEGSADRLATLMLNPAVRGADYIIAPDDSLSIEMLGAMADDVDAVVLNLFNVRSDAQLRHESVIQTNIPHTSMYERAIDAMLDSYTGYVPVILNATDIEPDKQAFISALTARMDSLGTDYRVIDFEGELTAETLPDEPGTRFLFIPTAASREMLTRIAQPLVDMRARALLPDDVRLFGYPDWVVLRGDLKDKLHKLNTAIYSRFASNSDDYSTRRVEIRFEEWFGRPMAATAPVYGLLGFDTGRWILESAATKGVTEPYHGLQNSFEIEELPEAGMVNDALYFIYFTPDGKSKIRLL